MIVSLKMMQKLALLLNQERMPALANWEYAWPSVLLPVILSKASLSAPAVPEATLVYLAIPDHLDTGLRVVRASLDASVWHHAAAIAKPAHRARLVEKPCGSAPVPVRSCPVVPY